VPRAAYSAAAAVAEKPLDMPSDNKVYPEKLHNIVSSISQLSLIEVSELNQLLKVSRASLRQRLLCLAN
jgi:hypothetical protein